MQWLGYTDVASADITHALRKRPPIHANNTTKPHCPIYWDWFTTEEVELFSRALRQYPSSPVHVKPPAQANSATMGNRNSNAALRRGQQRQQRQREPRKKGSNQATRAGP